ncbi:MAG: hypothetical protein K1X68_07565 [Saprospiraceae bacterium]|nr:hypothetical protein [Saprospiraceae bacterium]HMW40351.1 zinc dependent phospholipase C family protein [Saprospiraceae bacterium]HMX87865.1 zinc dependent phospholipase C family protein [Saprospiraceae bacterium]HMZ39713.1 zinc dependent phospholipase C family protein [Saprospiraceae bacterium]HNA64266.1 zinc dependent phospholipase C family protein [Saprospiraceae bacterium]
MKYITPALLLFCCALTPLHHTTEASTANAENWGFFAHRLLNRLAVFTLPSAMIDFYKSNIEFIEEHAIDPDKRRYALRNEAPRHFIDLDHWGVNGAADLPRRYEDAIVRYAHFFLISCKDTMLLFDTSGTDSNRTDSLLFTPEFKTRITTYRNGIPSDSMSNWVKHYAISVQDPTHWIVSEPGVQQLFTEILPSGTAVLIRDRFSVHGILPYSLPWFYKRLVKAFSEQDHAKIIRLSAEIGHYVGDAHVPLHTSVNYNGQLTNQEGIHAFWESRIPELFAESDFDFVVGRADYIENIEQYIWQVLDQSHHMVRQVLAMEKKLSGEFAVDNQYCFETRLGVVTKLPCKEYAARYNQLLDYHVEKRFRDCIHAIGSIWFSAWTEAGQPYLNKRKQDHLPQTFPESDLHPTNKEAFPVRDHE